MSNARKQQAHAAAVNAYKVQMQRAWHAGKSLWITSRIIDRTTTATLDALTVALKDKLDKLEQEQNQ